jgi:hypothetical protein
MTVSPDPRLESARPACRVLPEQTEGPYHRQAPPERVDITEDCEGMPLRVGLRLLDTDAVTPLRDAVVEVWQADATGRYSGFARVEPHADGTPLAAEEISDEQVAPQETFLRGSQRTDAAGTCQFLTIWPGWYSGRTIHIHVIVHLGGAGPSPPNCTSQTSSTPRYSRAGRTPNADHRTRPTPRTPFLLGAARTLFCSWSAGTRAGAACSAWRWPRARAGELYTEDALMKICSKNPRVEVPAAGAVIGPGCANFGEYPFHALR